jgi:hypothetical protein
MNNFVPTLQGTAERAPGTRFLEEIVPLVVTGSWTYIGADNATIPAIGEWNTNVAEDLLRIRVTDDAAADRTDDLSFPKGTLINFVGGVSGEYTFLVTGNYTQNANYFEYPVELTFNNGTPDLGLSTLTATLEEGARIIPFLTTGNTRSLVILTPGHLRMIEEIGDLLGPQQTSYQASVMNTVIYRKEIVDNGDIRQTLDPWRATPGRQIASDGQQLGSWYGGGAINMIAREFGPEASTEPRVVRVDNSEVRVDVPTDIITIDYNILYTSNVPLAGAYELEAEVQNFAGGATIWKETLDGPVGTRWQTNRINIALPTVGWTGRLRVIIRLTAKGSVQEAHSTPHVRVERFQIWADGETELTEASVITPYSAEDLKDIHFVQSPYGQPTGDKELVLTHPKHPPSRFYFDTGGGEYVLEPIPFTNQPTWTTNNYPSTCTSYLGRLILAGGQSFKVTLGDPVASVTETVWGTEVTKWDVFSLQTEANPDDSIEFTVTYRSPIQWAFGHKTLMVGALEYEYIASADGIFSPGDLGVDVHSTNGSRNVQPAGIGEGVLFAADGGRKVRAMNYSDQDGGWVSQDMTLLNPDITASGIRRMIRLRNPHQMCMCLLDSGNIALFHTEAGVQGWSELNINRGSVKDICVVADSNGIDIPYMTVERYIDGENRLYLESIPNWVDGGRWDFMLSSRFYNETTPTNILTNLEHLEGEVVQVVGDSNYIGNFKVSGGQVELLDQVGEPIPVVLALVGIVYPCALWLLPPEKNDEGARARYSDVSVRILGSTLPFINGKRPSERRPSTPMDISEPLAGVKDLQVANPGWDSYQFIIVSEEVPLRVEVLGVYGKLTTHSP